jgi:uncharacterized membrane protein (DUF485 family)
MYSKGMCGSPMSTSDVNNKKLTLHPEEWDRIATSRQFRDLLAVKRLFIVPAFVFFLLYYFVLPVLVGYAPKLMGARVFSTVTVGYLFALSQFLVGWLIAGLYLRASAKFDRLTRDILDEVQLRQGGR